MTDTDHDKIIRMEEKIDNIEEKVVNFGKDFTAFKIEYRKNHEAFQRELTRTLSDGMTDAKKAAAKYADNAVTSKIRDLGSTMFAEKRVQSIVYGAVKIILIAFAGSALTALGFHFYG